MKPFHKRHDPVEMIILLLGGFLVVMLAFFMARGDLDAYTQLLLQGETGNETSSFLGKEMGVPEKKNDQIVSMTADNIEKGLIVEEGDEPYEPETVTEIPRVTVPPLVKPRTTSTPPKPIASPSKSSTGSYYLQTGAFSSQGNADKMVNTLKSLGFTPTVEKSSNLFKVKVYGFTSKQDALTAMEKLKSKGIDAFIGQ